jgi:hypothetical protein
MWLVCGTVYLKFSQHRSFTILSLGLTSYTLVQRFLRKKLPTFEVRNLNYVLTGSVLLNPLKPCGNVTYHHV